MLGLPRKGKVDLEVDRRALRIPTVAQIKERYVLLEAWEERAKMRELAGVGRMTRRRETGLVNAPDQRGHRMHRIETRAAV